MNYIEFVGEKNSLIIDWTVSNVCNYDCHYCAKGSKDGSFSWPDIEQVRITVQKLVSANKDKNITYVLMGGELTLWKQFVTFIEMLRGETPNCTIKLLTNGIMPALYWQQNGKLFDRIQFSYHPEYKDNLNKFISAVNASSSKVNTVFVMSPPENFTDSVYAYDKLVAECPNTNMIIAKPIDGRAGPLKQLKDYTVEQSEWIRKSVVLRNTENIKMPKFIGINEDGTEHVIEPLNLIITENNKWKDWQCYVGVEKQTFNATGDITRGSSCNVGSVLGNWRTGDLNEIDTSPVICPYNNCFCGSDITVSRKKYY